MEYGYWGFKGRGQPHRILIAYLGLNIPEVSFSTPQQWAAKKQELKTGSQCPFPNLPYFKDGQTIVTESLAVAEAIAFKANRPELFGKSPSDKITHSTLFSVYSDIFETWLKLLGSTKSEVQASWPATVENVIRPKLEGFVKVLGDNKLLLHYFTYADILLSYVSELFEFLSKHTGVANPIKEFPVLVAHRKFVLNLPGIIDFQSHPHNKTPVVINELAKYTTS